MREAQVATDKPLELLKMVNGVDVLDFQESAGSLVINSLLFSWYAQFPTNYS